MHESTEMGLAESLYSVCTYLGVLSQIHIKLDGKIQLTLAKAVNRVPWTNSHQSQRVDRTPSDHRSMNSAC